MGGGQHVRLRDLCACYACPFTSFAFFKPCGLVFLYVDGGAAAAPPAQFLANFSEGLAVSTRAHTHTAGVCTCRCLPELLADTCVSVLCGDFCLDATEE